MPKVYKSKSGNLIVTIPPSIAKGMEISEGDEMEFIMHDGRYCIFAKEAAEASHPLPEAAPGGRQGKSPAPFQNLSVNDEELALLRKLDTVRYGERTKARVAGMLSGPERSLLDAMLKRGVLFLYKKGDEPEQKYGINNGIYDRYLFGKREGRPAENVSPLLPLPAERPQPARPPAGPPQKKWMSYVNTAENLSHMLEGNGYVVVNTEAEARELSTYLEDSIRHGMVVGTRAFNKKFYIVLRGFINRNIQGILKCMDRRKMSVSEISKEVHLEEDGVRAILYVLSESGDVSEVRRDVFLVT